MSETTVSTSDLLHHEAVMEDPAILRVLQKAKEIEALVNLVGNTTRTERAELLEDLDQMWIDLGYQGANVEATGWMTFHEDTFEPEDEEEGSQVLTKIVQSGRPDDQITNHYFSTEIISCGFVFVPNHIVVDDEIVAEQWRVCYEVLLEHPTEPVFLSGHADPEKVRFDFTVASPEHSRSRLAYFHPEVIDDIDASVLNCSSSDEVVKSLRGFAVCADMSDPHDVMMLNDAAAYLNSIVEFDDELPYEVRILGRAKQLLEEATLDIAVQSPFASLATLDRFEFRTFMSEPNPDTKKKVYFPCIRLAMHDEDESKPSIMFAIPPRSFESITSVRDTFYNS